MKQDMDEGRRLEGQVSKRESDNESAHRRTTYEQTSRREDNKNGWTMEGGRWNVTASLEITSEEAAAG